jgi:plastocyanin
VRHSGRAGLAALAFVALALLGPTATASGAERIVAIPQSTYATSNVAIDQGEPLTFLNLDALSHDVTARGKGPDGKPLFSTPLIGTGQEVPVEGADALTPGNYAFYCTIHPNMEGTLSVGGGGGGGAASGLEVRIVDSKLSQVRRDGALTVELTHDRSAEVTLSARTKVGGEAARLGRRKQEFEGSGSHPVEIPLSKGGRKALRGEDKAKVAVSARAEGSGGERDSAKARATLR